MAVELQRFNKDDGTYKIIAWLNDPKDTELSVDFVVNVTHEGVIMDYVIDGNVAKSFSMTYDDMIERLLR